MAIITLLTDFGLEDAYVGIVKGVILSVSPSATIVDISHNISPQDLPRAAYLIAASHGYFPPGTVHTVVVDPGVGSDRSIVGIEMAGHRFLAPDNGVLTAVLAERSADRVVRVENSDLFLESVSRTFHGRDIFAPVAARLSMGMDLGALGPSVDSGALVRLTLPKPVLTDTGEIAGTVIASDRFGNLITNIREQDLISFIKKVGASGLTIRMGDWTIHGLSEYYASVAFGEPLAVIGSSGRLELSINGESALDFFKTGPGEEIRIRMNKLSDSLSTT